MGWSKTEICNLAISHIGSGEEIANIDEGSEEARACKRFFEILRDSTLRNLAWPFATRMRALNLIEANPNSEWAYSYKYPVDALYLRRILSGQRTDDRDSMVAFKIINDDAGPILFTDKENAEVEFTLKAEDPSKYPSDFVMCFSLRLGFYIAPRLVGTNALKVRDTIAGIYKMEFSAAAAAASNEEKPDMTIESEIIRARY